MGRGEENRALSRDHKIRETQRDKKVLIGSQRRMMGKRKIHSLTCRQIS